MVDLQTNDADVDFWLLTRNMSVLTVGPEKKPEFESRLSQLGVDYKTQPLMELMAQLEGNSTYAEGDDAECQPGSCESEGRSHNRQRRQARGFFSHYPRYHEILNFMSGLAARYPQFCRYESLGRSNEGRHIAGLSISLNTRTRPRRVAYIQAGAHGREWITTQTVLYLAYELLTNLRAFQRVLQDVEVFLVPLVNPDGYEYTHTSVSGRTAVRYGLYTDNSFHLFSRIASGARTVTVMRDMPALALISIAISAIIGTIRVPVRM